MEVRGTMKTVRRPLPVYQVGCWIVNACRAPAQGKYVDDGSQEQDCITTGFLLLPSDGGGSFITPTGGMTKEQACDFTCTSGNTRINIAGSTRECKAGGPGTYVSGSETQNCWAASSTITAELDTRGATAWAMSQAAEVTAAENCQVAGCKAANQALNAGKTKCADLTSGQYKSPSDHTVALCGTIAHAGSGASWATDQSGVTSADACKIACATDAGNHLGSDTTGTDATCEQQCSPTNAPADSGRKAWSSSDTNWSTTCKPTVCDAGYDDHDGNDTCEKTEAGFYASGSDRKDSQQCTVRYIDKKAKPASQNAVWSLAESTPLAVSAHTCRWDCKRGYEENLQGTDCVKEEEITTFNIKGLASHPDGISPKGSGSRTLVLEIVATGVTHWHVTPDASFTPNSITDPASVSWNQSDPTGDQDYTLVADSVSEGSVTLYLWIAGGTGTVKQAVTESDPFTLDMTAPTLSSVAIPSDTAKLVVGESNAHFNLSVSDADVTKYEYCFGQNCSDFEVIPNVTTSAAVRLSFDDLSSGTNYVTFRVSDWVGNVSETITETFALGNCTSDLAVTEDGSSDPIFENGLRTRTCNSERTSLGDWTVTCDENYHVNSDDHTCESNSRVCPNDELPVGATAGQQVWDVGGTAWNACVPAACDEYYKKNIDSDACVSQEEITQFEITGLAEVGSVGNEKKVSNSRSLSLEIAGTDIDRWYVTHTPEGTGANQFSPTTTSDVETALELTWTNSGDAAPTTYTLPDALGDGNHTLYVYGADGAGNVKIDPMTFAFYLDTTPPSFSITDTPSNPQIAEASATFQLQLEASGEIVSPTAEYCMASSKAFCKILGFTKFPQQSIPLSVTIDLSPHIQQARSNSIAFSTLMGVTFRVTDAVGNFKEETHTWSHYECVVGTKDVDTDFSNGKKERTCNSASGGLIGAKWGSWVIASCNADYQRNADADACIPAESIDSVLIISRTITYGQKSHVTNLRRLNLFMTGELVSHWYVTHIAPSTFTPTSTSDTEVGRTWSTSPITTYDLTGVSDGDITLYTYVADSAGKVKISPATTRFYLDTTPPTVELYKKPKASEANPAAHFKMRITNELTGAPIQCKYCRGTPCNKDNQFRACSTNDVPFIIGSLNSDPSVSFLQNGYGAKTISFKITDPIGNVSTSQYSWDFYHCIPDSNEFAKVDKYGEILSETEAKAFAEVKQELVLEKPGWQIDKTKAQIAFDAWIKTKPLRNKKKPKSQGPAKYKRTCASDGLSWGDDWSFDSCKGGYYKDVSYTKGDSCIPVLAKSGKYAPETGHIALACPNTLTANAAWTNAIGSSDPDHCTWDCNFGYTKSGATCSLSSAVTIHRGDIPNLRGATKGMTFGGDCSGTGSFRVEIFEGNYMRPFKWKDSHCGNDKTWEVSNWNLKSLLKTTIGKEILKIKVSHEGATATTTINNFCPNHYVAVPPDLGDYATQPFCVAKYEMKTKRGSNKMSNYADRPLERTRDKAITDCENLNNKNDSFKGTFDLITNNEWQALARNIEGVASNWSGGSVGSGYLSTGSNYSLMSRYRAFDNAVASKDDNKSCINTLGSQEGVSISCDSTTWHVNRRTFTLSNGEVIWDLAGNYAEFVKDSAAVNDSIFQQESRNLNNSIQYQLDDSSGSSRTSKGHFGSLGDYSNNQNYVRFIVGLNKGSGLIRGFSSVFSAIVGQNNDDISGFRCVYRPSP